MEPVAIQVEQVSKVFGRRKPVQALDRVSFTVQRGEIFGLIGPNGAGKTTLLSCLLGFLDPDSGRIAVDGFPPDALEVRRRTGYLPERVGYSPELSGRRFLELHARLLGLAPGLAEERIAALAGEFGLSQEVLARRLATYSRGMRQRIGMVQALLGEPSLLFLDEPASGMDPEGVWLVRQAMLRAKARGATVLLNSHQLAEIEKVCDRVAFLRQGKLERLEVLRQEQTLRLLLRTSGEATAAAVAALQQAGFASNPRGDGELLVTTSEQRLPELAPILVAAGVPLLELRQAPAELEKLFLEDER